MTRTETILSSLPGDLLGALKKADQRWQAIKSGKQAVVPLVQTSDSWLGEVDWDVAIAGGTLGILMGLALVLRGWRVGVLERGNLRGREQEWNISRQELKVFLEMGLLRPEELERAIASEYNPVRLSFGGGPNFWVKDVLNVGVNPVYLLEVIKQKFLAAGGQLLEQTPFTGVVVHPDGVAIAGTGVGVRARLLLDAMGHFSPIVQQSRQGQKPDGMCLVVGSCAQGYPRNDVADLMVSFTSIQNHCQYFWEAFPAREGRTTYLFTYLDAHPQRPSLADLLEDYWRLLPSYQGIELEQLRWQRVLFGLLPSYRQSPLRPNWDRILQIGDSSGGQSPLSFGGFGAMLRHLSRLSGGIDSALKVNALLRADLGLLQPYQPNLAVTWMLQRSMSVRVGQQIDPNQINRLLTAVFTEMTALGEETVRPFLQDVIQFGGLSQTLLPMGLKYPQLVAQLLPQVGLATLADWTGHYLRLGGATALFHVGDWFNSLGWQLPSRQQHTFSCWLEALRYGTGQDFSTETVQ
jgi:lycopene cyclase CruP